MRSEQQSGDRGPPVEPVDDISNKWLGERGYSFEKIFPERNVSDRW
jgi:hypothetical protein